MTQLIAIVPVDLFRDSRLDRNDLVVMGVIFSFKNRHQAGRFEHVGDIAARCDLSHAQIRSSIRRLVGFGWLKV